MDWSQFFSVPKNLTFWDLLNSNAVAALLGAYLTYTLAVVKQKLNTAVEKAEDAESIVRASETAEESEASVELPEGTPSAPAAVPNQAAHDYRDEAAAIVQSAKDLLWKTVRDDTDQRHQRTYLKLSKHRPLVVAAALKDRGQLTEEQYQAAAHIFVTWQSYSKGLAARRTVPKAIRDLLVRAFKELKNGRK